MEGSICIVARNNLHLTKRTVASALAQDVPCRVLVIDNHSSDGTLYWLKSKDKITYISMVKWESLADCWNLGLHTLECNSYSPVLMLNNDIEISSCTYRVLRRELSESDGFITGVGVNDRDEYDNPVVPYRKFTKSPHPDFSCFMISRLVHERVGDFDGDYWPAYCEDSDYHIRMHKAGVKAISINLPFLHHGSQTLASASPSEATLIKRGADDNRERLFKKYGVRPGTEEYNALFTSSSPASTGK